MSSELRTNLNFLSEPFGSVFGSAMTVAPFADGDYTYAGAAVPLDTFSIHPGAHVLHYASSVFEGMKAHRQLDGSVAIFRLDDHVKRLQNSTAQLALPIPEFDMARQMIVDAVVANIEIVPTSPGSLYIRPVVFGTFANVGAAASPAKTGLFYVITCPVGDYFAGGIRPLTIVADSETPRTTPQFGMVKSGANYAMALKTTLDAKQRHGADQILFATNEQISETGAANFFVVDDNQLITPELSSEFLHGTTRASLVALAADLGYEVKQRSLTLDEVKMWATSGPEASDNAADDTASGSRKSGEAFLSGTAAVIAPVGTLIHDDTTYTFGDGQPGPNTLRLRQALVDMQVGKVDDVHGWRYPVKP